MTNTTQMGRITESRTDPAWGRPAAPVKNAGWFENRSYTPAQLSIGPATEREWYTYDATAMILRGPCAYEPIAKSLAEEDLVPIKTSDGKAIASIWFNILRDSVCGAYHEIVISIDATPVGEDPSVKFASTGNPFCFLYNNFEPLGCRRQFLHSLYINSPLSISWGREMQGFPKHPEPVNSRLDDADETFEAEIKWEDELIVRAKAVKHWGLSGFLKEGLGLLTSTNPVRVTNFLMATDFKVPIQMPRKTADQYNVPTTYLTSVRKGKNPTAVQCWPWSDEDTFELGDFEKSTGSEENNAHALLKHANFTPKVVTYVPFMQAHVETAV